MKFARFDHVDVLINDAAGMFDTYHESSEGNRRCLCRQSPGGFFADAFFASRFEEGSTSASGDRLFKRP